MQIEHRLSEDPDFCKWKSPAEEKPVVDGPEIEEHLLSFGIMDKNFRDYCDLCSILKEGSSLRNMLSGAGKYADHALESKNILSFISNGENYKKVAGFEQISQSIILMKRKWKALLKVASKRSIRRSD